MDKIISYLMLLISIFTPAHAEDIFFKVDDGKIYAIDDNTLAASLDESGELMAKLKRKGTLGIGTGTERDPIYLGINGKYFGKYALTLLKTGQVEFPTLADAQNTLHLCEQLGLIKAADYVENYIKFRTFPTIINQGFCAFSLLVSRKTNDHFLLEVASKALYAAMANDTDTLISIYREGLIDINFPIPTTDNELVTHLLDGSIGTPVLGYAAEQGNIEAVQVLLSFGANPTLRTVRPGSVVHGNSILDRAKRSGNKVVIRHIKKAIKNSHKIIR